MKIKMETVLCDLIDDLHDFLNLCALGRASHTAVEVIMEDFPIHTAENGLRRKELIGNINAVAILFHHAQQAVDLSSGCLQEARDSCFI